MASKQQREMAKSFSGKKHVLRVATPDNQWMFDDDKYDIAVEMDTTDLREIESTISLAVRDASGITLSDISYDAELGDPDDVPCNVYLALR